jgi:uncharacterized protein (UPF0332 family)
VTDQQALKSQIEKIIKKSRRALETARSNFDINDYEAASSKAYYAIFHIMQAALLLKGLTYSKHSGVISGFSKEFIKTEVFPKEFSNKIRGLSKDREISDYSYSLTIERQKAQEDIKTAEEIIKAVEVYLREKT